jgi:hypothetical protein
MSKEAEFVKHIRNHLREYGFKLIFGKGENVNVGESRCSGYFLANRTIKEIRVAKNNGVWLNVLAHEYCHFLQWLESSDQKMKKESNAQFIVHEVSIGNYGRWSDKEVDRAFRVIMEMERDCEIRTVRLLKQWGIKFDEQLYIKRANLYIYMHHMWKIYKTQRTKYDLETSRRALDVMPKNFRPQSHVKMPARVQKELSRAFS